MAKQPLSLYRLLVAAALLLVFPLLGPAASAAFPCPSKCACNASEILCTGVNGTEELMRTFAELAAATNEPLNRISVRQCVSPVGRLEALPSTLRARSLEISACGLTLLGPDTLNHMAGDLIELRLPNNSLTAVPYLQKLKNLQVLNLNRNQLDEVKEDTFNGMESLAQLRLKSNKICKLPSKAFNEVKGSLELLDLSFNCLSSVPAPNLRSAIFLKHLDLSGNQITVLKDLELMNLPELKEIRLNGNRIGQVSVRAFVNVPGLTHLYLKENELETIDPTLIQTFKQLKVIDLSGNRLKKIPTFKDMAELKYIYLQQNRIQRIDTLTFSANPKLQIIVLMNNDISLIARNSFDSLGSLTNLLLTNNSLKAIEPGVFDGMPNLMVLSLRNNSITGVSGQSFASLPELGQLDLAHNQLTKIPVGAFAAQKKLYWLDLSNNRITTMEKGAVSGPIATILLNGNELVCDTALDWFITYLVQYNIRTFLPRQPEVTCAAPPKWAGHRLKNLMIKKANDTLNASMQQLGIGTTQQQRNNFLANLLPALVNGMGAQGGGGGVAPGNAPILNTLTQAIPSLRSLSSGWNGFLPNANPGDPASKNLESAVEQFAEPLVRFSTGAQPAPSDIGALIKSIPNLIVNLPGYGNIDISKVHPKLIEHVLNGGTIPGVSKEAMDSIVRQIMQRVYAAAAQVQGRPIEPEIARTLPRGGLKPEKYLRPLNELPPTFVTDVMQGKPLPYLTTSQTEVVKEYYTQSAPVEAINNPNLNLSSLVSPTTLKLFNLLPPGYNISKLPPDVIQSVMKGEMPDISRLPLDLQLHIRDNFDKFVESFGGEKVPDVSVDSILNKLPKFDQVEMTTFAPYDINAVDSDLVVKNNESAQDLRLYIAIALGLVSTATLAILIGFCIYVRKQRLLKDGLSS